MEAIQLAQSLEALGNYVREKKVYETYYEAKTVYENLDQHSKTILAQAEIEVFNESKSVEVKLTQLEITRFALTNKAYTDHLEALKIARKQANDALAVVKSIELRFEVLRSLNRHFEPQDKFL